MTDDPHETAQRAAVVVQRGLVAKDSAGLDQAIDLLRQAIQVVPENHPDLPMHLSNLGVGLQTWYRRTGELADLDEAIKAGRDAVDMTPADHPDRPMYVSNLSAGLQSRFGRTGDLADLEEAITVAQQAAAATPAAHAGRAVRLSNLSGGLLMKYRRTGEPAHLDEAIEVGRQAVAAAPRDHPDRPMYLSNLGNGLRTRFRRTSKLADLNEAIDVGRQAVAAIPENHPERPSSLLNLSSGLRTRFERAGELADIDQAIDVGRQAVAAIPENHPDRPMYLSHLGAALRTRFQRTGRSTDLNEAIATARAAVAVIPADHPDRPMYLTILASGLRSRFERVGDLDDLDEAIVANDQAVEGIPADHPNRPMYLANLGNALRSRSERTGQRADLDEAVAVGREAVAAAPSHHPDRRMYLSDLSVTLMIRFLQAGEESDLAAAIAVGQGALDAAPVDHPDRPSMLSNLGGGLLLRYERTGEQADLSAAITVNRAAADASPADHPDQARILLNLGSGLRRRYRRVGDPADAEAAMLVWQQAAALPIAPAAIRIGAARAWGVLAASLGQWSVAVEGYAAAVHLLPLLAWRGIGRPSRERLLQDWAGLAADAAGCAIAAEQPDRAVELLEQGRGVLWSQILETRTDLTQLQQVAPELATRLDEIRRELDRPAPTTPVAAITHASARSAWLVDRQMTLADQWDELVDQVRALPGFGAFLRPPQVEQLRPAAADGPVVIVNISQWRCDALLVTDTNTRVVELSALSHDIVQDRATTYLDALQSYESTAPTPATMQTVDRAITTTLEWLWEAIAQPVLTELGYEQGPDLGQVWPRLWWCPTGPLALLPLHAAGYHDPVHKRRSGSVLDRAVSSYTPTLRALAQARTTPPRPVSTDTYRQLLIVALRNTPGQPELPSVDRERDQLIRLLPSQHALREGPAATRQAVRHDLACHAWAHLSCHGNQYPDDPSRGGLVLYDGMLTVLDVTADEHQGEFVFLSACKTAIGGVHILDEAITLAAALQHAGWRHVIATLWSVLDVAAAEVTEDVYSRLADRGELHPHRAAEALHHAIRQQRDTSPGRPSRWVPFLHHGP
jgi:tetratricopeptide (TPR) repeat protein